MKAVLVFIDGTICDRRRFLHLDGTPEFFARQPILASRPVAGSVQCLRDLATQYELVYIGARPPSALSVTREWLHRAGFPDGNVYLAEEQSERLTIVRRIRADHDFAAGIGDRWDDNELHLEIGCMSIIVQEHAGNWDTVRKHLLREQPRV